METYYFIVVFALIIAHGQAQNSTTMSSSTTTNVTSTTTATNVKPNSTTTVANTTTTPTSIKPTTASPSNVTTTMAPIVPVSNNGTMAAAYTYSVRENNNTVCIVATVAVKLVFSYSQNVSNTTQNVGIEWNIPNATVSPKSYCGNVTQGLFLTFFEDWEFSIIFNKTVDKYEVMRTSLQFVPDYHRFPNISANASSVNTTSTKVMFTWADNTFMKCHSNVDYNGFSNVSAVASLNHIITSDVVMNAFQTGNSTAPPSNGAFTYCTADTSVSNIVPIAVGAALAGLVLIVLIAYLIGRSRNQRGYESV